MLYTDNNDLVKDYKSCKPSHFSEDTSHSGPFLALKETRRETASAAPGMDYVSALFGLFIYLFIYSFVSRRKRVLSCGMKGRCVCAKEKCEISKAITSSEHENRIVLKCFKKGLNNKFNIYFHLTPGESICCRTRYYS